MKFTVKTTQIRKFLDATNRLKLSFRIKDNSLSVIKPELQLLRPKLAYAAGRQKENENGGMKALQDVIEAAITKVNQEEDLRVFSM